MLRVYTLSRERERKLARERARSSQRASESDGRPRGTSTRGVLAWMTRHCRGARVPRTLGHSWPSVRACAPSVVHVRSCATQCAGNRQRSTRPHSDLYTSRGTATGCIYTGVYMRATNTLTRSRRSLAVIAHTSTTQLLAARCGIIYPII